MNFFERVIKLKTQNKSFRIGLHFFFWMFYWLITYYFNTISLSFFGKTVLAWLDPLCGVLNLMLFYYLFMYWVWPYFLQKKRYITGLALLLIQIIIYTTFSEIQERVLIERCHSCTDILAQMPASLKQGLQQPLLGGIVSSLFSLGILFVLIAKLSPVMAFKISMDLVKVQQTAAELEKENILLEFNFLKSQVNPHFLFNTLNNIHSLVYQDRKQDASETVAKLSDFLRHSLYESGGESISLAKEIKLIHDYIELEKLRLNKTDVNVYCNAGNDDIQVPPLLFIPLVENAFKYTADNLPVKSFIHIKIELTDNKLIFQIRNNYDCTKRNHPGGIGLKNLQKRLLSYYPEKHQLEINDDDGIYEIKITIEV